MKTQFALKEYEVSVSNELSSDVDESFVAISGIRLVEMLPLSLALNESGSKDKEHYQEHIQSRFRQWLETLSSPLYRIGREGKGTRLVEIRLFTTEESLLQGKVEVVMLFKLSSDAAKKTESLARAQADDMLQTLLVLQPDARWEPISSSSFLQSALCPFEAKFGAEITRRMSKVSLASTAKTKDPHRKVGFKTTEGSDASTSLSESKSVNALYPYQPIKCGWNDLMNRLLIEPTPFMIRLSAKPTTLTEEETHAFHELELSLNQLQEDLQKEATLRTGTLKIVQSLVNQLNEQREAFEGGLFEVHTEIFGPVSIPQGLIEFFGSSLTLPVGNYKKDEQLERMSGGFDFELLPKSANLNTALTDCNFITPLSDSKEMKKNPLRRWRYLMDSKNALTAFHPPFVETNAVPGIAVQSLRQFPVKKLQSEGLKLGINGYQNRNTEIKFGREDRRRHCYIVGQTGTGKSSLIEKMILDDIYMCEGVALLDPHGDLVESVLSKIPKSRAEDVVYINPYFSDRSVGLNMLEFSDEDEKLYVVQEIIGMMERLFDSSFTGPIFYNYLRMGLLYVMSDPNYKPTLLDLYRFFTVPDYPKRFDISESNDPILRNFARNETFNFTKGTDAPFYSYLTSKLDNFLGDYHIRNMICQQQTTINFDDIMNKKKILLVNLAKGLLGEINSRFLGMLIVSKLQLAAMRRVKIPMDSRTDFYLYVDEFQNITTTSFATLLAEARKFKLNLILANQFVRQLKPEIANAIRGNVGTSILFRLGVEDAELFEKSLFPFFSVNDIMQIPNWNAIVQTMVNGQVISPFSMQTVLSPYKANPKLGKLLEQLSYIKYATFRTFIERQMGEKPPLPTPAESLKPVEVSSI
jgi:hypothetical protein